MISDVTIRAALEEDFPPLCALYCKSVQCNKDGFIQDLDFHGCLIAKTREWRAGGGEMLVARRGGGIIAMGALAPEGGGSIELCKLHVEERHQGQGLGREMSGHLIALAVERGFSQVNLHVTTTQEAAIKLYLGIGFRAVGRRTFNTEVFGRPASFDTLYMNLPVLPITSSAASATR
jgi:ribosomal protein S18 acetylase RimI-like enzyme